MPRLLDRESAGSERLVKAERPEAMERESPAALLGVAAWCGLLAGFAELLGHGIRWFVLQEFLFLGPDVIWTAPVVNAVLFLLLGLALIAAARLAPRRVSLRGALGLYAGLGLFGVLYIFPQIHRAASVVLALGFGVQVARWAAGHREGVLRLARRTTPILLLVVALLGAGLHLGRAWAERRAVARLPAWRKGAPNVLLIVLDTVRAFNLSLYGYPRSTSPTLVRLAREGVRFDRAFATAPWTLPSHATMFTGRLPDEFGASWLVPLERTWPTLAEVLDREGYVTAGFAANTNYVSAEVGLARGFSHFEDYTLSLGLMARNASLVRVLSRNRALRSVVGNEDALGRKSAVDINRSFLHWLDGRGDARPFFAFLNFYDAHRPYLPPPPYDRMFVPPGTLPDPRLARHATPGDSARIERTEWAINAYDGGIAYLDAQLGVLFAELDRRHLLEQTVVVITGDHGEEFGEHGLFDHGNSLYRQALQVPLLVRFPPAVPRETVVPAPVSLRDLAATIADLAGAGGERPFPGASLARYWLAPGTAAGDTIVAGVRKAIREPESYPASQGDLISIAFEGYRYILNLGNGHEAVYDFEHDPLEREDLIDTERGRAAGTRLKALLALNHPPGQAR